MKGNVKPGIQVFLLGIFLASMSASGNLLDFTLVPRFCSLALCLSIAFYFLYRSKFETGIKVDAPLFLFSAYTIFVCISALWANTKSESYFESAKQVLFLLTFVFTLFSLKKDPDLFYKNLTRISILVFFIALGFGLFQFLQLKQFNKEALYSITGINGHKNLFSSFLFLNLFFLLLGLSRSKGRLKVILYFCLFTALLVIAYLKTKAVWLGIGVCLASFILLYLYHHKVNHQLTKKNIFVFVIAASVLINGIFLLFFQDILSKSIEYTSSLSQSQTLQANTVKLEQERLILWDKTLTIVKKHPMLGVGSGNWQVHLPDAGLNGLWRAEDLNYTFQRPHNDFLWILSETGIIGFNLFLFFLLFVLFQLVRILYVIKNNREISLEVILCFSFILGFYTISFFDFPKERMEHSVWIAIILGIASNQIRHYGELRILFSIKTNYNYSLLLSILLCGMVYMGVLRFRGEYFTRKMLDDKNNDNKLALIQTGSKALSFVYSIDPTSVPIHWYIGNAQAALGNYLEAKQNFTRASVYAPFNRNVLNDLASSFAMNNEREQAKKYYEESARISPRFDDPKLNLAAMYIQENNFKEAQFWLNSLLHDSERRTQYQTYLNSHH